MNFFARGFFKTSSKFVASGFQNKKVSKRFFSSHFMTSANTPVHMTPTAIQSSFANLEITSIFSVMLADSTNGVLNTKIKIGSADELCSEIFEDEDKTKRACPIPSWLNVLTGGRQLDMYQTSFNHLKKIIVIALQTNLHGSCSISEKNG
eukprot:TRINITY_DN4613_c0_g2_i3.p1 TRINITY_DN4613_c0_g2~~TRINITY_DN4613_c0_g2_i3.p1  ORF type:complete len:150 (-),score=18.99 TRINITY_DN4613_c0_g2_i3:223-672(-)